jgi:hypothetical protein
MRRILKPQIAGVKRRSLRYVFEEAHDQIEKGKAIPHDQFWKEVERGRRIKRANRHQK